MARKRTPSAPFALALDGSLLLNQTGRLDAVLRSKLAEALSVGPDDVFIGTRLPPAQRADVLTRLDNAGAEAAARIHGFVTQSSSRSRSQKTYKKV